jgi:hypothetical protein
VSETRPGGGAGDTIRHEGENAAARAAGWLGLAAAPTFAMMALLTGLLGGNQPILCSARDGMSALSGMIPMYLLMSAFHSAPWLKLILGRGAGARRT